MTKKQQRHIIATAGTVLFLLLVFLLLWFCCLTAVAPEQAEGVEVEFAEIEELDEPDEPSASAYAEEPSEAAPAAPASPAPVVATDPKPASPPEHIVSEEETLALERARKEREEREAAERARKKKEAEAIAKANAMGNLFGKTDGTSVGGGDTKGEGQKGNPVGHGTSGTGSWKLDGRGIKGTLPAPANNFLQEGKVVVQIRVNAAGQVVNATITGGDVSDKQTQQLALDAAKRAKFTEGDRDQIGTITYIFKLN
ncbi:MAG: energy transducer TonB [Paludibacteraceae bacterium]|nr:energy transducer TonB [Paludibacteraceae bacterium]